MNADDIIAQLGLIAHPEGGFYRETFRASALPFALPGRGERAESTAIYFLLRAGDFSAVHSVTSDEVWHHYFGSPLELHLFHDDGRHEMVRLGKEILAGEVPQFVVPKGVLQAARVAGAGFSLCGCTVAPGFDFRDFEMPPRADLIQRFSTHAPILTELTRV